MSNVRADSILTTGDLDLDWPGEIGRIDGEGFTHSPANILPTQLATCRCIAEGR